MDERICEREKKKKQRGTIKRYSVNSTTPLLHKDTENFVARVRDFLVRMVFSNIRAAFDHAVVLIC